MDEQTRLKQHADDALKLLNILNELEATNQWNGPDTLGDEARGIVAGFLRYFYERERDLLYECPWNPPKD